MLSMTLMHVAADDCTGALEVAGMCADVLGRGVLVTVAGGAGTGGQHDLATIAGTVVVSDLATRHLTAEQAAEAAATIDLAGATGFARRAHKMDSTLRGNWSVELIARQHASGGRVLLVPAFPAAGRTCAGGVVHVHGVPVGDDAAGADARSGPASSRPADLLRRAGLRGVVEVRRGASLEAWLGSPPDDGRAATFAVCDAVDDDDLVSIAGSWAAGPDDVLFAGTAGSIAAAARALAISRAGHGVGGVDAVDAGGAHRAAVDAPVLVVCGSLHPIARAQLEALVAAGAHEQIVHPGGDVERRPTMTDAMTNDQPTVVLRSPVPDAVPVADSEAHRAAVALAASARQAIASHGFRTVVVIGGDTAAALLGDAPAVVGGTLSVGMPWFRVGKFDGPLFVTRAGGFGNAGSLTELIPERTTR